MRKVFDKDGDFILHFASDAKEQITKWLDGVDYDYAVQYAKIVEDSVFGEALCFPCTVVGLLD